jgi:hypothetical protein
MNIGRTVRLVPGPATPPGVVAQRANNNLDVCVHDGRRYLVWRTAPIHFASPKTVLHVVSTTDGAWFHEATVSLGRDVREPRFLSWDGRLMLFFTTLGRTAHRFEPDRVHVMERNADGWTTPEPISPPGYLLWRPRVLVGRPVITVYGGGGAIYTTDAEPTGVECWTTTDGGATWGPIDPSRRVVHVGGSETEIVEAPGGGFVAVTRKEGPHGGWGSDVCVIRRELTDTWERHPFPIKLDSPYLFRHRGEIYLVARRQLASGGRFDLGWSRPDIQRRTKLYQLKYWLTRKRTSLWRIALDPVRVEWLADLPSRGDTCFPAVVDEGAGRFTVYNYSSPLQGRDRRWISGQLGPTWIYATELTL